MKLSGIPGTYDAIFSLGENCTPSLQLRKLNLRPFSGVFDWMVSELTDVNKVLENRFAGFMQLPNLKAIGMDYAGGNFLVMDKKYRLIAGHDFPERHNTIFNLSSYPEYRAKLDRRIYRTLHYMMHGRNLLFVRTDASFEEAQELERVLNKSISYDYRVLIINHVNYDVIEELDWPLEKICAVQCYSLNPASWETLLQDVKVR
ncbi:DUF1796 family putative cysteine peptidase [Paenibacillus lutrae]|uniref:Papain-like cysteine peptidase n=1 Tax=Paenibacillus lutrae TaxID=2078573 RepID=A0A7X3JXA3_9BACL|nr:DUF1796 family putative cysteine peptidase [Paenibacillus lutrae]MVO97951.1 papain-like cysteine peptidase [Paenibacillus lutrae]